MGRSRSAARQSPCLGSNSLAALFYFSGLAALVFSMWGFGICCRSGGLKMAGRQSPCPGIQLFGSLIARSRFLYVFRCSALMGMALVACFCLRADPPRRDTQDRLEHLTARGVAQHSARALSSWPVWRSFLLFKKTGQIFAPSGQSSFATLLVHIFEVKYPDISLCSDASTCSWTS